MKYIIIITFLFFSCQKQASKTETLITSEKNINKSQRGQNSKLLNTAFIYYNNGIIKEKGCVENRNRVGWWSSYNISGKLISKSEFVRRNGSSLLNQKIDYKENGDIDYKKSSFFEIELKDTIKIGKTAFKLKYYSNIKNYKTRFIYIIIDNQYSGGLFKKDTFTDDISKLWFGVNAYKKGNLEINGIIEEETSFIKKQKDSSQLIIKKDYKYFKKNIYVLP